MTEHAARRIEALSRFPGRRILVVGDIILDEYLMGMPTRVSREAPALVLELRQRLLRPGGGANPAVNVRALGGAPRLVGVVGNDAQGIELREELARAEINADDLVCCPDSPTIVKTRILADSSSSNNHQIVRLDRPANVLAEREQLVLSERIASLCAEVDAVLLSDYKGGVINAQTIDAAQSAARARGKLLTVDSQGDLDRFRDFDLVKCNREDAETFLRRRLETESDYESAGQSLRSDLRIRQLVITRGSDGMSTFSDAGHCHLPALNRTEVFDVTGAGDTVIAVLTLALTSGASLEDAAYLANVAAGEVVRRLGVATTSLDQLRGLVGNS